jgi:hypothetical protein
MELRHSQQLRSVKQHAHALRCVFQVLLKYVLPMQRAIVFDIPTPARGSAPLDTDIILQPLVGDPELTIKFINFDGGAAFAKPSDTGFERFKLAGKKVPGGTQVAAIVHAATLTARYVLTIQSYPPGVSVDAGDLAVRRHQIVRV